MAAEDGAPPTAWVEGAEEPCMSRLVLATLPGEGGPAEEADRSGELPQSVPRSNEAAGPIQPG